MRSKSGSRIILAETVVYLCFIRLRPYSNSFLYLLLAPSCPGGLDLKSQEVALRAGPDVLIATPGRLIDHLHNTPSFELSHIEILILDEADR